jgi:hypothetical protein
VVDDFTLYPTKEGDVIGTACLDTLFAIRNVLFAVGSSTVSTAADFIAVGVSTTVLDDSTAPLSLAAAACAGLAYTPNPSASPRRAIVLRVLRALLSTRPEDCSLVSDDNFAEPVFRLAVFRVLGLLAPQTRGLLDDVLVSSSVCW